MGSLDFLGEVEFLTARGRFFVPPCTHNTHTLPWERYSLQADLFNLHQLPKAVEHSSPFCLLTYWQHSSCLQLACIQHHQVSSRVGVLVPVCTLKGFAWHRAILPVASHVGCVARVLWLYSADTVSKACKAFPAKELFLKINRYSYFSWRISLWLTYNCWEKEEGMLFFPLHVSESENHSMPAWLSTARYIVKFKSLHQF